MTKRTLVVALVVVVMSVAVSAKDKEGTADPRPKPIDDALVMLGWGKTAPEIRVVTDTLDPRATDPNTHTWVVMDGETGKAIPVIYVLGTTQMYRGALAGNREWIVNLAGFLAHEREHITQAEPDEVGPFQVQLTTLVKLNASNEALVPVRQALKRAQAAKKALAQSQQARN